MDTKEFHISTGKELIAVKDRVRNLIQHWGEDGRHKEAVLKTVIERFLPAKYRIATGFVVKQTNTLGKHVASPQIDLLVYDNSHPVLFRESDFVIVTPDSVHAIIEVKSNLENQGLKKVLKKANDVGQFIWEAKADKKNNKFFNGVFSYDGYDSIDTQDIRKKILAAGKDYKLNKFYPYFKVNHVCLNKDWFFKFWNQGQESDRNSLYEIEELSFSFFISNLMDCLGGNSVIKNSNMWFPIDKSIKERDHFKD